MRGLGLGLGLGLTLGPACFPPGTPPLVPGPGGCLASAAWRFLEPSGNLSQIRYLNLTSFCDLTGEQHSAVQGISSAGGGISAMPPSSASASASSASFVQQHGHVDYSAPFGAASLPASASSSSPSQHLMWSRSKSNAVRNTKYTYLTCTTLSIPGFRNSELGLGFCSSPYQCARAPLEVSWFSPRPPLPSSAPHCTSRVT